MMVAMRSSWRGSGAAGARLPSSRRASYSRVPGALLRGDQHLAHRCLLQRVEPPGGAEVGQPQPAVLKHQHVARMGVGVKAAVDAPC